jgi:tetratricopeptide (TPR) repeat protein
VTTFEIRLPVVREQERLRGGGGVLSGIGAELTTARQMLDWPLGTQAHLRLLKVVAELSRLAGWAAFDAKRPAAAEGYFIASLRAAREARDQSAVANTIKSLSLLLLESGRPADAHRLLGAGERAAARGSLRIQAMVATRQARVEAVMGNAAECQARLGQAESFFTRAVQHDDYPPETEYFDRGELAAQTAISYQILGRHTAAVRLFESTLSSPLEDRPRDRDTYQLRLCRSALADGELDRVCAVLLDSPGGLSPTTVAASGRNQTLIASLRAELVEYRDQSAVRGVDERLQGLLP